MKHLFKKGLSLFLAVLMVVSMLPMDALAVAFVSNDEDVPSRREEAVLDVGDSMVDTLSGQSSRDDREAVETPDPGDGEDEPAKPSWTNLPLELEIDQDGNYTIKVTANGVTGSGGSGNNAFAIMLDKAASGGVAPGSLPVGSGHANASALSGVVAATKLPNALFDVGGDVTFTFAADGSYNGEVLQGTLGSFQDFLTEAQKIDPSLSGEIPLRVILVTQAGSPSSPAGVSQATFTWKAGKDAVLKADSLNGGTQTEYGGVVPGDGFIQLTQGNTTAVTFGVYPDNVIQDATITITDVVYTGLSQENITMSWPEGTGGALWPSGMDASDAEAGWNELKMELDKYNAWSHPSGLIEGTVTITYVVDGIAGTKALEIPVRTKVTGPLTGTKITVTVPQGGTATGGSTTVTSAEGNASGDFAAAGIIGKDLYAALRTGKAGQSLSGPELTSHESNVQTIPGGITWSFVKTIPDLAWDADEYGLMWGSDGSSYDASVLNLGKTGGAFGNNDLVQATVGADVALGTHFVGNLVLPYVFTDLTEGVYYPASAMLVTIPVFVEVIEGEVTNNDFTLKYDANGTGVSSVPGDQTYSGPETTHSFTLTFSPAPTRTGYVFKGWSDSSGSSNTADYTDGGTTSVSVSANSTKTVYAVWAPTYTVTYQNSSTTGHPSVTVPTDANSPYEGSSNVTILGVAGLAVGDERDGTESPTPKVYKFLGWDMGGTKYYTSGTGMTTSFTISANSTLTAAWEEVTYTVKYDMNGVTATNASSFTDETGLSNGATATKAAGTPLATGKTFTGWKVNGSGSDVTSYTVDKDDATNHVITLVAQWGDNDYTVTFDRNNGTWSDSATGTKTTTGKYADKVTVPAATVSRVGYTFAGWNTKNDGSGDDLDTSTDTYGAKAGTTYYAKWTLNSHTLTWDGNGGSWSGTTTQTETKSYGAAITAYSTEPTRTNYVFAGWYTAASGGSQVNFTGLTMPDSNVIYYAHWTEVYTVKYSANGKTLTGSVSLPSDETELAVGDATTGANVTLSTTGWTFAGWNTKADGSGTNVATNAQYTVAAADAVDHVITLYAKWTQGESTIHYDWNYTGSAITDHTGKTGATDTPPKTGDAVVPTRTGYTWDGKWYTTAACATEQTTFAFPAATGGEVTYYANWTHDAAKVTFHTQSGTWASDFGGTGVQGTTNNYVVDGHYHDTLTVPTTANISRTGYTFQGWATSSSSATTVTVKTKLGEAAADSADYYAVWKVNQHTLKYDMQSHGTDQKPSDSTQDYGATVNLSTTPAVDYTSTESNIHWVFKGWMNAVGDTSYITSITMPDADKTVYAKWEKDTHTLTYDDNVTSETIPVPSQVTGVECGTSTAVDTTALSRTGYTFLGWSTNKSATSATYASGAASQTITLNSDTTLYAIWKINTYTVTYDKGDHGGSDVPSAQTGNYNTTVTLTGTMNNSTESNIHWIFKGWSTTKNDTSTKVTKFDNIAADHKVYALWEKDTHTLTYNANAGGATVTNLPANVTGVECGTATAVDVTTVPVWNASHRFLGWDTDSTATTPTYPKGVAANITLTSNTTLYAIWESVVTVTWKTGGGTWSTGGDADKTQTDKSGSAMTTYTGGTDVTRAGYRFKEWSNNPGTTMPNADTTYTAQWDRLYNVVFDLNAPSGATDITVNPTSVAKVTDKIVGETATLTALSDTQGNYVFKGWATTNIATTATYTPTGTYTVVASHASGTDGDNAKITLYGVWVKKTNVTYNTGAGAWATAPLALQLVVVPPEGAVAPPPAGAPRATPPSARTPIRCPLIPRARAMTSPDG